MSIYLVVSSISKVRLLVAFYTFSERCPWLNTSCMRRIQSICPLVSYGYLIPNSRIFYLSFYQNKLATWPFIISLSFNKWKYSDQLFLNRLTINQIIGDRYPSCIKENIWRGPLFMSQKLSWESVWAAYGRPGLTTGYSTCFSAKFLWHKQRTSSYVLFR